QAADDDAVILARRVQAHEPIEHVAQHRLRISRHRIPVPTAAGEFQDDPPVGGDLLRPLEVARLPGVQDGPRGRTRTPAAGAFGGAPRAIRGGGDAVPASGPNGEVDRLAQPAALTARSAGAVPE